MKTWKPFNEECARCGNYSEVFTTAKEHGHAYDGDDVRCVECGLLGCVTLVGEDDDGDSFAYVSWDDYEDDYEDED